MSRKLIPVLTVLLLGLTGAGVYLGVTEGHGEERSPEPGSGSSLAIPAATVEFRDLDGGRVSLEDFRGKAVVLNLWGTWCPPCRREIPHLAELHERIEPRGGTVVGLAVDSGTPEEIRDFLDEFGVDYPVWRGRTQTVVEHYEAVGFPTTLIVDREGIIRERYLGPRTAEDLLAGLEPYLEDG